MRALIMTTALAILASTTTPAQAQNTSIPADIVDVAKGDLFNSSTTYLVPAAHLFVTANGNLWVRQGSAQAKGRYFVEGLSKALLQGLAMQIQTDLITKLRAAGFTVLTFDDIKGEPDVLKRDLREPDDNPKYGGMAVWRHGSGRAWYVVNTPTDAQLLKPVLQGPHWGLRNVTKEKNALLLVPEYYFDLPQMIGEKEAGYKRDKAGINVTEALQLEHAIVWLLSAKGGGGTVQTKGAVTFADSVGKVTAGEETKLNFGSWKKTVGDFDMTIDPTTFSAGILRGGYAFNDVIVATAVKQKK
jgi:hypothetical protein